MLACTHPAFDGPVILLQDVIEEATFGWRTLAAARASRKKRSRVDSSPKYLSPMILSVTGQCR